MNSSKTTIAVTGASGFIGSRLIELLAMEDVELRLLTRKPGHSFPGAKTDVVVGDARDPECCRRLLEGADCLFHLLGEHADPRLMEPVNVGATRAILDACKAAQVKKLIHLSSAGVTGQAEVTAIDEETPCAPGNEYERTKLEAERLVRDYAAETGACVRVLRPTIVFGEGGPREHSFYQLLRHIKNRRFFLIDGGRGEANYVYVGDVAEALMALHDDERGGCAVYVLNNRSDMRSVFSFACEAMGISYAPLNVGYESAMLASRLFAALPGFPLTPSRVKAMRSAYTYKSDRIRRELKFDFPYGLRKGISRTVRWLEDNRWL